jgi:tRNA(Ile)-lysidine synthase
VLVGASGGADSSALVLVLVELGFTVGLGHLNHGLRGGESDADQRFVQDLAERLNAPFFSRKVAIQDIPGNLEAVGRAERRKFLESVREREVFDWIALGHHRGDRVETFLLNLARGAGTEGLAAMPLSVYRVVRPLLDVSRGDIEAYLVSQGISWRTDSTNGDPGFARNRMRHVVVPELERHFNPRVVDTIARTAMLIEDEDRWMRELAENWMEKYGAWDGGDFVVDADALALARVALQRRIVRLAFRRVGSPLTDVGFERIEAVRALVAPGKSGKVIQIGGGMAAARAFRRLVFGVRTAPRGDAIYDLAVPGEVAAPAMGMCFRASIVESIDPTPGWDRVFVDGVALGPYVRIRAWQPGDYYRPVGWRSGKLKELFQRARIPKSRRIRLPVFVTASGIVWVASFPVSREFAVSGRFPRIVALEALPDFPPIGA